MEMKRKAISKSLRFSVLSRDGFACRYCGRGSDKVTLTMDHIIPHSKGGPATFENLISACEDCNGGKSNKPLSSAPNLEDACSRMAALLVKQEAAAQQSKRALKLRTDRRRDMIHYWCSLTGRDDVDAGTLAVMMSYSEEEGADVVMGWIAKAAIKCAYDDRKMGRYVSGIRRKIWEEKNA